MALPKKPPLLFTLGTAGFLIGGGAIAYWGLSWQRFFAESLPVGVKAIPETATVTLSLSTDPEQWRQLRQFGTPQTQADFDQRLAQWRDRWFTQYGLSFQDHLEPWVGDEVTIALLPTPLAEGEADDVLIPRENHQIVLLPIADREAAQAVLADFAGSDLEPTDSTAADTATDAAGDGTEAPSTDTADTAEYRGVTLTRYDPSGGGDGGDAGDAEVDPAAEAVWMGVLGTELVLVADDIGAAEQAIDAYKGGRTLADLPGYGRAFDQTEGGNPFGKLYVSVPAATQFLAQASQPAIPPAVLSGFQASRGLVATVDLASQGIQIQSVSWLLPDSDRTYAVSAPLPETLPDYLPQETVMMASGSSFEQFWTDLKERRTWSALTALDPDALALTLQSGTGLVMENDLIPWLGGEFALALVSPPPPEEAQPGDPAVTLPNPGLILMAQTSDRPKADQTFAQLDEVVASRYRFTINTAQVEDSTLTEWASPFGSLTLSRGWLTDSVTFLTVGNGVVNMIAPVPNRPLATDPLFQLVMAGAPEANNGHFYLNLGELDDSNRNLFLPNLPADIQGVLQAIQAIGVTATILDERQLRYDLFLALRRGDRPGALPTGDSAAPPEAAPESTPTDSLEDE
ncbi:MAG: DUF3352 domain-containing protein [Leptolyngbya sp. RL_3_1]|nr:DUF3352 domain-containing protein [Leptolyngbya sp. RL_3_1]